MKTVETTIYECEFCKKYYKRKHFAVRHEKYCRSNPENQHLCFECKYLERRDEIEEGEYSDYKYITFFCTAEDDERELHSYVAERRGMEICKYTERMRTECKHFDPQFGC